MSKAAWLAAPIAAAALWSSPARADDPSLPRGYGPPPGGYAPPGQGAPGYPPPGYAPYGYPPPNYGLPPGYAPPASPPQPAGRLERRNPTAMGVGIGFTAVGAAFGTIGSLIYLAGSPLFCSSGCDPDVPVGTIVLYATGAAALAVGIPLIIYGAKKVPVVTRTGLGGNRWIGAPGGPGWQWRF